MNIFHVMQIVMRTANYGKLVNADCRAVMKIKSSSNHSAAEIPTPTVYPLSMSSAYCL